MDRSLEYQRQGVASLTPIQLVIKLYDIAIAACYQNDRSRVRKALAELMASLNVEEGGDFSARMLRIYEYCMDQTVSGDLNEVRDLLLELRNAWKQADQAAAA